MKNNLIVKILIGIQASGKTTFSKEYVKKQSNWVRVNRDDFRYMLQNKGFCEPNIENLITELSNTTIIKSLLNKQNVIIDNTHCKVKYINDIIKLVENYADVEFQIFDVPLETCIERDKNRDRSVGEDVIRKFYKEYCNLFDSNFDFSKRKKKHRENFKPYPYNNNLSDAVIFDVDNTLALMKNRNPYDWNKVDQDELSITVKEQIDFHIDKGRYIIILSGRDSICKNLTEQWLIKNDISYDFLYMRGNGDYRKDSIIKKEIYENNIKDKYNVIAVFDDRLQVLDMWYKQGLFTFNVNQGNIEF